MRRLFKGVGGCFFIALMVGPVMAEIRPPSPEAAGEKRNERLLLLMTTNMTLSADQQAAIKAALDAQTKKITDLRKEFAEKQKAVSEETDAAINARLSDEQKGTYAKAKEALEKEEAKAQKQRMRMENPSSYDGGPGGRHAGRYEVH